MESDVIVQRESLFRLLGKCLVQGQAVEILLKRLLAVRTFGGTVEELEKHLAARHADYQTNTLGTLVKEVLESYLVPEDYEAPQAPEPRPCARVFMHVHQVLTMSDERLVEMRQLFTSLVGTRNDVVHHLAERFPLRTACGLAQALDYVGNFEKTLDEVWLEVKSWADSHERVTSLGAEFAESLEFQNLVFDGIQPDGTVDWLRAGIVSALHSASAELKQGGWTSLDEAIQWIRREEPIQIPSRYNCTTYRQVIHASAAFEVKREHGLDGATTFLFRPKR